MKYHLTFALCATATIVLVHLIVKALGFDDSNDITIWLSVLPVYLAFYGVSNPLTKPQSKEEE